MKPKATREGAEEDPRTTNPAARSAPWWSRAAHRRHYATEIEKTNFGENGMLQSVDVRTGRVFNEDVASFSMYSTITSEKVQNRVLIRRVPRHGGHVDERCFGLE